MVDFRYHLVSILAVFLALAVGIVLGTTTINDAIVADLKGRVDNLTTSSDARRAENDVLGRRVEDATTFAEQVLPAAVVGRLDGRRVTVVSAPGAHKNVRDGVDSVIEEAGGKIAGRVQLRAKLADPDPEAQQEMDDLAAAVAPTGLELPDGSPIRRVAAELADVLGTSAPATEPREPGERTPTARPSATASGEASARKPASPEAIAKVLSAFEEADLISVGGDAPSTDIFVVVAPTPSAEANKDSQALVRVVNEVAGALAATSRAVVAVAPRGGAAPGGVLSGLRRDASLSSDVSSVDNGDTAAGRVALVFAIVERLDGGFGHYGDGSDAIPDLTNES